MATRGGADPVLSLSVRFAQKQLVLNVKRKDTVHHVIEKAAAALKESNEGLTLLLCGAQLRGDALIGDAIGRDMVTVLHLQKHSNVSARSSVPTKYVGPTKQQLEPLTGFCRGDCGDMLCSIAPVFQCGDCRNDSTFKRHQDDVPVDFFAEELPQKQLMGKCTSCRKESVLSYVSYECKQCKQPNTPFLRQVHHNIHHKPCMQCGVVQDTIFLFACSSRHSMCLDCFSDMCKIQLNSDHFRQFPSNGYSVGCPGSGADCSQTPVGDPHHFYLIDCVGQCYRLFKDMSIVDFQPAGDNIFCCCKNEIDVNGGKEVDVTPAQPVQPNVGGGMWWRRIFQRTPPPPKPVERKMRRRVSCRSCEKSYCVECKQFWHEGECQFISPNEDISQHYQIDPIKAEASRWPQ